jgi:hypothetical protein
MPMKLLSFVQTKDSQQKEQALKVMRAQEIEELASKANAKLARAEADFQSTLAKNRAKWALEEEEHAERLKAMEDELKPLEERKRQALIPLQLYKERADEMLQEAKDILVKAQEKEAQADFLQEKLEDKLTSVADREQTVTKEEQRLIIAKEGIQIQQEQIKANAEKLTQEIEAFHEKQRLEETSLLERKKEVSMAEISFQAKVDKYKRDIEALRVAQIQVEDQRQTLERTLKRGS